MKNLVPTQQIYLNTELSNADYHANTTHVSGSSLVEILNDCPAKWRYRDRTERTDALIFGSSAHELVLEPELFNQNYVRGIEPNSDMLTTNTQLKDWLKNQSIKGYSGGKTDELIDMIKNACQITKEPMPKILSVLTDELKANNPEKEIIKFSDYDSVMQMRNVLEANGFYQSINGASVEHSLFSELNGVKVKCRFDILKNGHIKDYKTSISANGDKFFRNAKDLGYLLKMALQYDIYESVYGQKPKSISFIVQEKKSPFIAKEWILDSDHLLYGRLQYRKALDTYKRCLDSGNWTIYGDGEISETMPKPDWFMREIESMVELGG